MSRLGAVQRRFQAALVAGDAATLARLCGRRGPGAAIGADVYVQAYRTRLAGVLHADYPCTAAALGAAGFAAEVATYVQLNRSATRSLRWYGAGFADHLARRSLPPWHAELAHFEWLLGEAFDAPDAVAVTAPKLRSIPPARWPALRLVPQPSMRLAHCAWNTVARHATLAAGAPAPAARRESGAWLIWRSALSVRYRPLPPDHAAALECMRAGGTFAAQCATLEEFHPAAAARAAELLAEWLALGLLAEVATDPRPRPPHPAAAPTIGGGAGLRTDAAS
jgi:hypothetical protein